MFFNSEHVFKNKQYVYFSLVLVVQRGTCISTRDVYFSVVHLLQPGAGTVKRSLQNYFVTNTGYRAKRSAPLFSSPELCGAVLTGGRQDNLSLIQL